MEKSIFLYDNNGGISKVQPQNQQNSGHPQQGGSPYGAPGQYPQQPQGPHQQQGPGYPEQMPQGQPYQGYPQQGVPQQAPPQQQTPQATLPPRPKNTTQNSLLFSEIRDNMMIMSDGSFRSVIACKSINFDLMSSRERDGVIASYQNFINSLTHPIQILVRSQRVDIGPYLQKLIDIRRTQDNMLLGVLMDDYIEFIDILSAEANIMDKSFYVVVPYSLMGDLSMAKEKGKSFFGKLFGSDSPNITRIDKVSYQKAKDEIKNRVDSVMNGLFQMGVHCTQLNSKEIGELYYNYYNPDTATREPLGNFEQNTFTYVKKGEGEASRPNIAEGSL